MNQNKTVRFEKLSNIGFIYGLVAYTWWALASFYFKALSHVPVSEVLAHRIIWSAVILVGILMVRKSSVVSIRTILSKRTIISLVISASFLFICWFLFVWAVIYGYLLQLSFGYFIYPIVCVLLGYVFLKERFQTAQLLSIVLVIMAVIIYAIGCGAIPILSIIFAFTFALYGILHKKLAIDPLISIAAETIILAPICITYLIFLYNSGILTFGNVNMMTDLLLVSAGIVTAVPLVCFISALHRMRYSSLGMMMYIMPTITMIIAVFSFGETFDKLRLYSFIITWIALAIYVFPTIKKVEIDRDLM
jgi:chloramphenicol-sensitive protein RarD